MLEFLFAPWIIFQRIRCVIAIPNLYHCFDEIFGTGTAWMNPADMDRWALVCMMICRFMATELYGSAPVLYESCITQEAVQLSLSD